MITDKIIINKKIELYTEAQQNYCDNHNFSVYENLTQGDADNYEFLSWYLGEKDTCYIYEEIFKDVRDILGFGVNDDMNYYGDNSERYGEPLTDKEQKKLLKEIDNRIKAKLKEILK